MIVRTCGQVLGNGFKNLIKHSIAVLQASKYSTYQIIKKPAVK